MISSALAKSDWIDVNRPCLICGSTVATPNSSHRYRILPRPFVLNRCQGCQLLFNSPRIADLGALYEADYYVFSETEQKRYGNALAEIKRHLCPAYGFAERRLDILEVGSAKGHLLHLLKLLGHDAMGVELSQHAAEYARQFFGANVYHGAIEAFVQEHPERQFDVVWCNDVIEHVPDPLQFVTACAKALKPGGRLILDTPNGGSAEILAGYDDWIGYNPYHIFLFDHNNLAQLCRNVGLDAQAVFTYHNQATAQSARRRVRYQLKRTAERTGLISAFRWAKQTFRRGDGDLAARPMSAERVATELAKRPWFTDSADAQGPRAGKFQGDNLVVHVVKPAPGRSP
ncbi:MAG: methyltransferase domain-containing protein [Planctomycetaceae bacterium]|nr:methyltransferase domain-containing protein [Planctomycetaceae bacterium]